MKQYTTIWKCGHIRGMKWWVSLGVLASLAVWDNRYFGAMWHQHVGFPWSWNMESDLAMSVSMCTWSVHPTGSLESWVPTVLSWWSCFPTFPSTLGWVPSGKLCLPRFLKRCLVGGDESRLCLYAFTTYLLWFLHGSFPPFYDNVQQCFSCFSYISGQNYQYEEREKCHFASHFTVYFFLG